MQAVKTCGLLLGLKISQNAEGEVVMEAVKQKKNALRYAMISFQNGKEKVIQEFLIISNT